VKVWISIPIIFSLESGKTNPGVDKAIVFKAPVPVDGFEAFRKNLKYPELARKAGVEGRVMVKVLFNEN
jgi:hypothetical protein